MPYATFTYVVQYHRIVETVDSDRIVDIVDHIFIKAIKMGASDIHVEPQDSKVRVRFRVDGSLVQITDYPKSYCAAIISPRCAASSRA